MLISDKRILEACIETVDSMGKRADVPAEVLYDLDIIGLSLRNLLHTERRDANELASLANRAGELAQRAGIAQYPELATAITAVSRAAAGPSPTQTLQRMLATFDAGLAKLGRTTTRTGAAPLADLTPPLLAHHNGIRLLGEVDREAEVSAGAPLTAGNLTSYFRERLGDPSAAARDVRVLNGGFGKETTLFHLDSHTLGGPLVMRRDSPVEILEGLDCHVARKEFPVLQAVYSAGFPVPEPLLLETATEHIPGPAFSIVRRAPGDVVGSALGGRGIVSAQLQSALANVTARVHSLPPLHGLDEHPAVGSARRSMTARQCAGSYLSLWYEHFLTHPHLPMPAMHALFNWLLRNLPEYEGMSSLVHGDIGLHNLLFDAGTLSALLDWEYSHVGDPAEDIGYIRAMMGPQLDWHEFLASYVAAGGRTLDERRIRYFEIWAHVRNAASILLAAEHFESGRLRNIKYSAIVYQHLPHFASQAERLIRQYDSLS